MPMIEEDILDDPGFSSGPYRGALMPRWFRAITVLVMITGFVFIAGMIVGMVSIYPLIEDPKQKLLLSIVFPCVLLLSVFLITGTIGLIAEKRWAVELSFWTCVLFFAYLTYIAGIRLYGILNGHSPKVAENIVLSAILALFLVFVLKLAGIRQQWKTCEAKPKK
ncbi:hypothetical protein ACFOTA_06390 [Chitinophaga sp. GCM10012297]|uniref:Uncharacterized protein n=1 Tax=Chitinophaga chungangae TaxID=2821488 RepID=A0ABS3YAX2_9BACT|nr:hypothetical protein [Chitinophaga chungangae]MBO9151828.1 hypothetical protein [Chitinophaga chungangae]